MNLYKNAGQYSLEPSLSRFTVSNILKVHTEPTTKGKEKKDDEWTVLIEMNSWWFNLTQPNNYNGKSQKVIESDA